MPSPIKIVQHFILFQKVMLKLGDDSIGMMHLGTTKIHKAYLGDELVYEDGGEGGGSEVVLPNGYTKVRGLKHSYLNEDTFYSSPLALQPTKPFVAVVDVTIDTLLGIRRNNYPVIFGANSNLQLSYTADGKAYIGNSTSSSVFFEEGKRYIVEGCFTTTSNDDFYKVDGVDVGIKRTSSATTFYLLGGGANILQAGATIHSLKIYNGEILSNDYVVCKRDVDGKCGLYDIINDIFVESTFIES